MEAMCEEGSVMETASITGLHFIYGKLWGRDAILIIFKDRATLSHVGRKPLRVHSLTELIERKFSTPRGLKRNAKTIAHFLRLHNSLPGLTIEGRGYWYGAAVQRNFLFPVVPNS